MSETLAMKIAVGDGVRVHFHPPGSMRSFSEGVVSRVDVTTPAGRFFVVDVRHELILDREHRLRPGFQDFVAYACQNDFQGRIEVLSATKPDGEEAAPPPTAVEAPEVIAQDAHKQQALHADAGKQFEAGPFHAHLEHQSVPKQRGLIATLFGRKK